MNILLINLTRFGDLLQSRALIHDLAAAGHRVGLVCLENFAQAARLLPDVTHIAPLPGASLLRPLAGDPAGLPRQWPAGLAALGVWSQDLQRVFPYDDVRNLTATLSARLLCRLLAEDRPVVGFDLDEEGFARNSNPWSAFTLGSTAERGSSPFNLVDLFRRMGQNPDQARALHAPGSAALAPPPPPAREEIFALLQAEAPAGCSGFVGFQLGASRDERRLPGATFADLGDRLWAEHRLCPVLLGDKNEIGLAVRYREKARHPFISLCGRTDLAGLAACLPNLRLLVSNDTGTLHLAAGLGLPVLGVYLATAQPFDTGPYRAGACTLEPDLPCHPCPFGRPCPHNLQCRQAISVEVLFAQADAYLRTGAWKTGPAPGTRAWLSVFDDHGFMDLRSLSGHENDDRTLWLGLQRRLLRQFLDEEPDRPFAPQVAAMPFSKTGRALFCPTLGKAAMLSELLAGQAELLRLRPLPAVRDKLLKTLRHMQRPLEEQPPLAALKLLFLQYGDARNPLDLPTPLKNFHALLKALHQSVCDIGEAQNSGAKVAP